MGSGRATGPWKVKKRRELLPSVARDIVAERLSRSPAQQLASFSPAVSSRRLAIRRNKRNHHIRQEVRTKSICCSVVFFYVCSLALSLSLSFCVHIDVMKVVEKVKISLAWYT